MKTITVEVPDDLPTEDGRVYVLGRANGGGGTVISQYGDDFVFRVTPKLRPVEVEGGLINKKPHISVKSYGPYAGRGFYLDAFYRWETVTEENGVQTLIAWEKPE